MVVLGGWVFLMSEVLLYGTHQVDAARIINQIRSRSVFPLAVRLWTYPKGRKGIRDCRMVSKRHTPKRKSSSNSEMAIFVDAVGLEDYVQGYLAHEKTPTPLGP